MGSRKLACPNFNGDILNYLKFKKHWKEEVVPERKPVTLELAALREAVPVIAKGKLIDISNLTDAWKLLDLVYGDAQEIRAKLKDQVRCIKLKTSRDSSKLVELFHAIQIITAQIKDSGSLALLEYYEEYMALVKRHLPKEIVWKWCHKDLSGWASFFNFLEKEAKVAKKMITNESINSALSGATDKPQKCTTCHKNYPGKCQKTKTTAVVQGADKTCPVCSKHAHKYKTKLGVQGI